MKLPVTDILLFVDTVSLKSFTAVAKKHRLTPNSVSKRIAALEKSINSQLFYRTTRSIELTEAGELFYKKTSALSSQLNELLSCIQDLNDEAKGIVKFAGPSVFGVNVLLPLINEFKDVYPDIDFDLNFFNYNDSPVYGSYDLAVVPYALSDSSLFARQIACSPYITCASPSYLSKRSAIHSPDDLLDHACLDLDNRPNGKAWLYEKKGKQWRNTEKRAIISNDSSVLCSLAIQGRGIVNLPYFIVKEALEKGELVQVLADYQGMEIPINIVTPIAPSRLPKKTASFYNTLVEKLQHSNFVAPYAKSKLIAA